MIRRAIVAIARQGPAQIGIVAPLGHFRQGVNLACFLLGRKCAIEIARELSQVPQGAIHGGIHIQANPRFLERGIKQLVELIHIKFPTVGAATIEKVDRQLILIIPKRRAKQTLLGPAHGQGVCHFLDGGRALQRFRGSRMHRGSHHPHRIDAIIDAVVIDQCALDCREGIALGAALEKLVRSIVVELVIFVGIAQRIHRVRSQLETFARDHPHSFSDSPSFPITIESYARGILGVDIANQVQGIRANVIPNHVAGWDGALLGVAVVRAWPIAVVRPVEVV